MWDTTQAILMWVAAVVLILANAGGVMAVIFQLPGTWIMLVVTAAYALAGVFTDEGPDVGIWWLVAMLVLAIIGEVIETVAGAAGARKAGGTKTGAVLAIVGGIAGAILGTFLIPIMIVGTIAGACIGAGLGAGTGDLMRGRTLKEARSVGTGAAVGKLGGTLGKVAVAVLMWMVATVGILWPNG